MDHLAQDLSVALEETESCGPISFDTTKKWGVRRRTRSVGNLPLYASKSGDNHSEDSCSSNSEGNPNKHLQSFHQSDSDEMSLGIVVARAISNRTALKLKHPFQSFFRGRYSRLGMSYSLESDSFNEHSPARPSVRRKRKLKRMSIDETPSHIPPVGKRKRPQRFDLCDNYRRLNVTRKLKPLHQSIVDRIEKFCQKNNENEDSNSTMEVQCVDSCEVASESSLSWSGGEGHEGDDELTDWGPSIDNNPATPGDQACCSPREIKAACRRVRDERSSFSISTGVNEPVAKFLQDPTKSELRVHGAEREKLGQLASLYYLEMCREAPGSLVLKKTARTPCMHPPQRHRPGHRSSHKRIRTAHVIS